MTSKRFRKRWNLAHLPFTAAIHKQYGNLDLAYMLAIWDAKKWLDNLRYKRLRNFLLRMENENLISSGTSSSINPTV